MSLTHQLELLREKLPIESAVEGQQLEEMIGQSVDIWKAARESMLGQIRPWFGYVMLLEDAVDSRTRTKNTTRQGFPPDVELASANALERYRVCFERLRMERKMDSVCLAFSNREAREVQFPDPTIHSTLSLPPYMLG